jgi:hypothetical protein
LRFSCNKKPIEALNLDLKPFGPAVRLFEVSHDRLFFLPEIWIGTDKYDSRELSLHPDRRDTVLSRASKRAGDMPGLRHVTLNA